jgi:type VI secretion system Hcp family effector
LASNKVAQTEQCELQHLFALATVRRSRIMDAGNFTRGNKTVAFHYYAKITGTKQGTFRGDSRKANRQNWIELSGFDMGVMAPLDAACGLASGKRQHKPVVITKPVGSSTPQLLRAWQAKAPLSEVVVEGTHQGSESIASRVVLTQAQIVQYAGAKNGDNAWTIIFKTIHNGLKVPSK